MPAMRRVLGVVALVVLLAGCGGGGERTFSASEARFTFAYPRSFVDLGATLGAQIQGRPPAFSRTVGTDQVNFIVASRYVIRRPFESYSAAAFQQAVDAAVRAIANGTNARIVSRGHTSMGGAKTYLYDLASVDGARHSKLALAFRGTDEYFLRCQWDASGAGTLPKACERAESSFKIV